MNLAFRGGKEFARFLQELPGHISAEILETGLHAGAQIIVDRAREKCPKPEARRRPESVESRNLRGGATGLVAAAA